MNPSLYLIDGHAQIYRAFHAVEGLTAPDGSSIGATYGFTRMLLDLIASHHPEGVAMTFDSPGPTFRHQRYAAYKETRKPTPPELISQVPIITDIVKSYGIPCYAVPGFEADDLIGTLTRQAREANWDVVIVSGDKDCGQLLQDGVKLFDAGKNRFTDINSFREVKGLKPAQLVDVMGLWGDTSDNIPGVPGIGEKTGTLLIQKYGSLENLLDHADEVTGKRGEMLRANKEQALLSKELATICTTAPVTLDLESAKNLKPDIPRLHETFTRLGFSSLLRRLPGNAEPVVETVNYQLVDNPQAFASFLADLSRQSVFALDTETTGLDPLQAELVGISFSWQERTAFYLPFRLPPGEPVLSREHLEQLKPVLENPQIGKTGHNLCFDTLVLFRAGIALEGVVFDSMIAAFLVDGNYSEHGLKALARKHYQLEMTPIEALIGSGRNEISMDQVPAAKVANYAAADADVAWRLYHTLPKLLKEREGEKLFTTVELPLSRVLASMQAIGIRLDQEILDRESMETGELLSNLTQEIYALAGHAFNIASPKQLGVVLFSELGLPKIRHTQTGLSTDEAVLAELASTHHSEIANRILEYRMYSKLKNTYLDALPKLINPETGRLHTSFSQTRTATGRLASANPNLQNIPIRSARGRAVRAAFIPKDGWLMLAADYSQVELRVLAHFCQDPTLVQSFADGLDIHRTVAAAVRGVDPESVSREERSAAKAINFGIIYGQGAYGLASGTGMSHHQAQQFIDSYFARFPGIRSWMDQAVAEATRKGYVETLLGWRRRIPELASINHTRQARARREAVNTIIQGTAADLVKTAMVNLWGRLRRLGLASRLLLQIHDELLLECPPGEVEVVKKEVREAM
ncbi:MAG: DNA polymerase I, partial [Planctomycetota bacterium]|nr:DNA polymerase I [Planctomycetota bacterium]